MRFYYQEEHRHYAGDRLLVRIRQAVSSHLIEALEISASSVEREWRAARAWLRDALTP